MSISSKSIQAAIKGPAVKKVKIMELGGSKEHEFNVMPISIKHNCDGELIVYGQISHHLSNRIDDQYWFGFKKKGGLITPTSHQKMIVEKRDGGLATTINFFHPVALAADAYLGTNASEYFDKLEEHKDKVAFLDFDKGHEKAIHNFLKVLSKKITPPKALSKQGLVIFEHDTYRGKKKHVKVGDDIGNFETIGFDDKASSLQALVPKGMKLEVFKHNNCTGHSIEFECGTHYVPDLKIYKLGDQLSSCQWSKV